MAWLEALTTGRHWDEQRDVPRVQAAFRTLAKTRRTWPTPVDFSEAMPPPPEYKALPAKVTSPEDTKAILAEINRIFART